MLKNPYPGIFIVIEGIDGSGKSSQIDLVARWLKEFGVHGNAVLTTHEPYTSPFGLEARAILEGKQKPPKDPLLFQELYVRDRKEHLARIIIPHLEKKGAVLLCDRYFFSTFTYGMAQGISFDALMRLHERILGGTFIIPDATFIIDLDPEMALLRVTNREGGHPLEYFEKRKNVMMEAARQYRLLAEKFPYTHIITGDRSFTEVSESIQKILVEKKMMR